MSSVCEFVDRNVAKLRLLERIENHPKFPEKYRGEVFQKYVYGGGALFHVYMLLAGWIGVWSFFSKCPSLQLYEKLVLVGLRVGVMAVHGIGTGFFLLGCVGGSALPICERVTHLYHQFMACYRSAVLPLSVLCLVGSLLSLSLDQFGLLLIFTPIEAVCLVWHIILCDAFLKWGNAPSDNDIPVVSSRSLPDNRGQMTGGPNDATSNKQPTIPVARPSTGAGSSERTDKTGGKDAPKNSTHTATTAPGASSSSTGSANKSDKSTGQKGK